MSPVEVNWHLFSYQSSLHTVLQQQHCVSAPVIIRHLKIAFHFRGWETISASELEHTHNDTIHLKCIHAVERQMEINGVIFTLSNVLTSLSPPLPSLHNCICPLSSCRQEYYFVSSSQSCRLQHAVTEIDTWSVSVLTREEANLLNLSVLRRCVCPTCQRAGPSNLTWLTGRRQYCDTLRKKKRKSLQLVEHWMHWQLDHTALYRSKKQFKWKKVTLRISVVWWRPIVVNSARNCGWNRESLPFIKNTDGVCVFTYYLWQREKGSI